MEIERGSNANQDGIGQQWRIGAHPVLLLRRPKPDPDDIGIGRLDARNGVRIGLGRDRLERRAFEPHHVETREFLLEHRLEL
ncbi:MAG: hypothetical protein RLZZ486_472, partial [Actinomycetota bacterium]